MSEFVSATAEISSDNRYRYRLTRGWDTTLPTITFVLLNPSTADAKSHDRTLGRCVYFAKREGFGSLLIVNLYAFRTKDPKVMLATADPIGPENDRVLAEVTGTVVAGWGTNADQARVTTAVALLPRLYALGVTKHGHPQHPLYINPFAPLVEWPR
jgi:hypothetical protein